MTHSSVTSKGQVTIPKAVRQRLGNSAGKHHRVLPGRRSC
ncbi:MAG: AbrB/MazE/SpoVT family DNA-binding domain-containing protein [Candidatus Competibacteraceae bacterium]|nr:AbrB/MazE/SpoVT family DNA-binding domain-containing protein [Candidatus Competibacteraceae bacterium]